MGAARLDQKRLRVGSGAQKSTHLIGKILASGLEPFIAPEPLPPIREEDIELLAWMAITV